MKQRFYPVLCLFLAIISLAFDPSPVNGAGPGTPWTVAHRGLLKHAPENTLSNFRACLELRIGFEFDVQRSSDGVLICLHDDTVDRTTNGKGLASQLTLAQLKELDAGGWFEPSFQNERIPTIEEVFALIAQYPKVDALFTADMKGADDKIEADVVALARKHGVLERLLFIGRTINQPEVRKRLRTAATECHTAALANGPAEFDAAVAEADADWVYVRFVPTAKQVAQAVAANKQVFIAGETVASIKPDNWLAAANAGLHGMLTDYPLELRHHLRTRR